VERSRARHRPHLPHQRQRPQNCGLGTRGRQFAGARARARGVAGGDPSGRVGRRQGVGRERRVASPACRGDHRHVLHADDHLDQRGLYGYGERREERGIGCVPPCRAPRHDR
jgi:hypothetical protein